MNRKLNLQLFSEEPDNIDAPDNIDKPDNIDEPPKTFTQDELNDVIEKRLAREKAKYEKELRDTIAAEKEEATRLAKLSADEREKELAAKTAKELEELKEQNRLRELEIDTVDRLEEEKLPTKFKTFLMGKDAESTNDNIKNFKEIFLAAVKDEVEEKLKGKTPTRNSGGPTNINNPWAAETFNLTEQGRILRDDPEMAKQLMNLK